MHCVGMGRRLLQICPKYMLFVLMFSGVFAILFYVKLRYIEHDAKSNNKIPCNISSLITDRFINDPYASCLFSKLVARKATAADPELIQLIRYMMDPPSKSRPLIQNIPPRTPQHDEINSILNNKVSCLSYTFGSMCGNDYWNVVVLWLCV